MPFFIILVSFLQLFLSNYWSYGNHINSNAKIIQINPKHTYFDSKSILNIKRESDDVLKLL